MRRSAHRSRHLLQGAAVAAPPPMAAGPRMPRRIRLRTGGPGRSRRLPGPTPCLAMPEAMPEAPPPPLPWSAAATGCRPRTVTLPDSRPPAAAEAAEAAPVAASSGRAARGARWRRRIASYRPRPLLRARRHASTRSHPGRHSQLPADGRGEARRSDHGRHAGDCSRHRCRGTGPGQRTGDHLPGQRRPAWRRWHGPASGCLMRHRCRPALSRPSLRWHPALRQPRSMASRRTRRPGLRLGPAAGPDPCHATGR